MFKNVFFDLDGTLTDSAEGIINSVEYALKRLGITVYKRSELYKFIGPPLSDSFAEFFGLSEEKCKEGVRLYREYFSEKGIYENKLYDGIQDLLEKTKAAGMTLVLATSKPQEFAEEILRYFDIAKYFDFIAAAEMNGKRNRKQDIINYALEISGAKRNETVMVGDRKFDVLGAKSVGVASIGVLYGFGTEEELKEAGADHIAKTPEEVFELLIYAE
ncbi:MAG: HAD family hydrolase [Oscillospiraceae bacterium]|nr:HAD family hydrolase [Oscillospiraceae bacterium]